MQETVGLMELNPHVVRYEKGKAIRGRSRLVFIRNGSQYFASPMYIWADGAIDCWQRVDMEGFRRLVAEGTVTTELPEGASVGISGLSMLKATDIRLVLTARELLLEVQNTLDELNQRPDAVQRCRDVWKRYSHEPSEARRQELRAAYAAVPEHLRRTILQDTGQGDGPIMEVIAGLEVDGDPSEAISFQNDPVVKNTIGFILSAVSTRQAESVRIEPGEEMVKVRFEKNGVTSDQSYKRTIHTGITVRLGTLISQETFPLRHTLRGTLKHDGAALQLSFQPGLFGAMVIISRGD